MVRLKYKIPSVMVLFVIILFSTIFIGYSLFKTQAILERNKLILFKYAKDMSERAGMDIINKVDIAKTLSSAPVVYDALKMSNENFEELNLPTRKKFISTLDKKWKDAKNENDDFVKPYLNNPLAKYLKQQQNLFPSEYGEIFITNRYGALVASTGKLSTLAHAYKYWWSGAFNNGVGKIYLDDRGFDDSVDGYVIGIVIPIIKDGTIIGILKSNINIDSMLNNIIKSYNNFNMGVLRIVRTNGLIVFEQGSIPLSTKIDKQITEKLQNRKSGSFYMLDDKEEKVVSFSPINISNNNPNIIFGGKKESIDHKKGNNNEIWNIVIKYSKQEILKKHNEININLLKIAIFCIIIFSFIAVWFGWKVSNPIVKLAKEAEHMEGEAHKLKVDSDDEIGSLAKSLNRMIDNLLKATISKHELELEIDKQKELEVKLISSKLEFDRFMHFIPANILIKNKNGVIIYANEKVCRFFNQDDITGKTARDLLPFEIANKVEEFDKKVIQKGKFEEINEFYNADGNLAVMRTLGFSLEINDEKQVGLVMLDITQSYLDKKELQNKEEIMIAQSRHAAMGEMISMIAHQWRQPISVIAMDVNNILVDLELDTLDKDESFDILKDIIFQTQELSKTIDDFRGFFQPNKSSEEILLKDIIDDASNIIGKSLENNNIEFTLVGDTSIEIKTFSRELMQVIINIINNAKDVLLDRGVEDKYISIDFRKNEKFVLLDICDNGGGVDNEIVKKIFEPYFTTKSEKNGTGLGLYMSKIIIEKHLKGSIKVSNTDDGACFNIELPLNLDEIMVVRGRYL